jgi:hypothetical protein
MLRLALFDNSSGMAGNRARVAWTATYGCLSRTYASGAIDAQKAKSAEAAGVLQNTLWQLDWLT